jgi:hypothetical protein
LGAVPTPATKVDLPLGEVVEAVMAGQPMRAALPSFYGGANMGLFDSIKAAVTSGVAKGLLPYGGNKQGGSHDHRYNKGGDRTPSQKSGDRRRSK